MKVLFDHDLPFSLAHGGMQTLMTALMRHVAAQGVEVEPLRWWDPGQRGDIIHFVQKPRPMALQCARQMGYKTLLTECMDKVGSESPARLWQRRQACRLLRRVVPLLDQHLNVYREVDELVYLVTHELDVIRYLYDLPPGKGRVIPLGLEDEALADLARPDDQGDYLISIATITPRKNTVLLAEAARRAQVPVIFVGKPYSEADPYYQRFLALVDQHWVRYAGWVSEPEKRQLLRRARGFVLLSRFESGCIAVHEAAAAALPLLLSQLPWATRGLPAGKDIQHVALRPDDAAAALTRFYTAAQRQPAPVFPVKRWADVAREYVAVYRGLCG